MDNVLRNSFNKYVGLRNLQPIFRFCVQKKIWKTLLPSYLTLETHVGLQQSNDFVKVGQYVNFCFKKQNIEILYLVLCDTTVPLAANILKCSEHNCTMYV